LYGSRLTYGSVDVVNRLHVLCELFDNDVHVRVEPLVEQVIGLQVHGARRLGRVRVVLRHLELPGECPLLMPMKLFALRESSKY